MAGVVIDTARRRVTRQGRPVPLTQREYQLLLEYLARHVGRSVTRTALWGERHGAGLQCSGRLEPEEMTTGSRIAPQPREKIWWS